MEHEGGIKIGRKEKKRGLATSARKLITLHNSKSIVAEQFRTIRTNISFSLPSKELKTIVVTSSVPGEGKSTIAANLGMVFAQERKKVLIVDADMRKPTLHYTFEALNVDGLSNVLIKKATLDQAMTETFVYGLSILPCGAIPTNPSELLSSENFDLLLEEIKQYFDIIIFDAPPLLAVTDALILTNKCDGTLLVVNSKKVNKKDVLKAKKMIETSQATILGVVLNNYKISKKDHYYRYSKQSE